MSVFLSTAQLEFSSPLLALRGDVDVLRAADSGADASGGFVSAETRPELGRYVLAPCFK
jgi:hypothetical protein